MRNVITSDGSSLVPSPAVNMSWYTTHMYVTCFVKEISVYIHHNDIEVESQKLLQRVYFWTHEMKCNYCENT
jgi:hypothetical protein